MSINNFCLYDAHDMDGFGSAYCVWRMYKEKMTYIPVRHGEEILEEVLNANIGVIYIVDFHYPIEVMKKLQERAHFVYIIDHHKSTEEELREWNPEKGSGAKIIDRYNKNSACILTWEHLFPSKEEIPLLLKYIEDRDLWKWELDWSKEVSAGLSNKELMFEEFDRLVRLGQDGIEELVIEGKIILEYMNKLVKNLALKAEIKEDENGNKFAIVNSCLFQSELGHKMLELYEIDYAVIYFDNLLSGQRIFSLRSKDEFDVSEIAVLKGGGGHKHASGYSINL